MTPNYGIWSTPAGLNIARLARSVPDTWIATQAKFYARSSGAAREYLDSRIRSGVPIDGAMTAKDIKHRLECKYSDGWIVLHEVANLLGCAPSVRMANRCGGQPKRRLDTVAIGMYQSGGHPFIGHEIKVSRGDWQRELADLSKAGAFDQLVTAFYIVAPKGVVKLSELPDGWGLMVCHPTQIRVARLATPRPIVAIPRGFAASLLARASGASDE